MRRAFKRCYVFFTHERCFSFEVFTKYFKELYGNIFYHLAHIRLVENTSNHVILSVNREYVPLIVASATFYALRENCDAKYLGVATTVKEGRRRFLHI